MQHTGRSFDVLRSLILTDLKGADDAAASFYRAAGEKMLETKARMTRREFKDWIKIHLNIPYKLAAKCMLFAAEDSKTTHPPREKHSASPFDWSSRAQAREQAQKEGDKQLNVTLERDKSFSKDEVYTGPGEEWLVVTCHNPDCQMTLLVERVVAPQMLDEIGAVILPEENLLATCPHCKLESIYRSDEIRVEMG